MPDLKRYSTTKATALSSGMTSGDTTVNLVDGSTYPDPAVPGNGPYTVLIGYGSDREEICTVTAKPSTNVLTVTRAQDGSSAVSKNIGDIVVHGVSKRDWEDMLDREVGGTMVGDLILAGDPTADLMAATKQYVDNSSPIGAYMMYASATPPNAMWLLANGQAIDSGTYPDLYAIVGANVPDLRDRFIVAAGSTYAQGGTGGAATVTLTAAQSGLVGHSHTGSSGSTTASHTHSIDPPATTSGTQSANHTHSGGTTGGDTHSHTAPTSYDFALVFDGGDPTGAKGSGGYNYVAGYSNATNTDTHSHSMGTTGNNSVSHTHSVNIASFTSGSGGASHSHTVTVNSVASASAASPHENLPPYYALTYMIKAL